MTDSNVMIRLLKARGGKPQGTIIFVTPGVAEQMTASGDGARETRA